MNLLNTLSWMRFSIWTGAIAKIQWEYEFLGFHANPKISPSFGIRSTSRWVVGAGHAVGKVIKILLIDVAIGVVICVFAFVRIGSAATGIAKLEQAEVLLIGVAVTVEVTVEFGGGKVPDSACCGSGGIDFINSPVIHSVVL